MLAGVISAGTTFVAYQFDLLQSLGIWMQGDFSGVLRGRYELLWILGAIGLVLWVFADRFTVASLGEEQATSLGLSYTATLNLGLALVAVASAVTLVVVGAIGFVGLIIPNLITMWRGDNLRRNIGLTAIAGSLFVLVCDLLARGLLRLRSRAAEEAARDAADRGEQLLHFTAAQRLNANRTNRRDA